MLIEVLLASDFADVVRLFQDIGELDEPIECIILNILGDSGFWLFQKPEYFQKLLEMEAIETVLVEYLMDYLLLLGLHLHLL